MLYKILNALKALRSNRVLFDDGSYVEYFNREAILYVEESGRQIEIVWYFIPKGTRGRLLYKTDINYWDAPYSDDVISEQKKVEIIKKIYEYCRKRSIPLEIKE